MEKNQIFKLYGTDYKEMTKRLLCDAELEALIRDRKSRIAIKPNLVSSSPAKNGGTTHPEIVAGIIEYLQERGFLNLVMMEGSWVGDRTARAIKVCGYDKLSDRYGVKFIDMQKDRAVKVNCSGMPIQICRQALQVDFMINVPVLKGHCQTGITCALKNMKGLIPDSEKRRFHTMGLHKPIAHLNTGVRQDFIVIDHICGDLDFEEGGNPVTRNCIMAARDPVLTDAYVCRMLHYAIDEVPYVRIAEQLQVGSADLENADIRVYRQPGMEMEPGTGLVFEFDEGDFAFGSRTAAVRGLVSESNACSACYGNLISALDRLRREGLLPEEGLGIPSRMVQKEPGSLGAQAKPEMKEVSETQEASRAQVESECSGIPAETVVKKAPKTQEAGRTPTGPVSSETQEASQTQVGSKSFGTKAEPFILAPRTDGSVKVCIGQNFARKTGILGVGRCTSGFLYNVKGCPPKSEEIYEFLKDFLET